MARSESGLKDLAIIVTLAVLFTAVFWGLSQLGSPLPDFIPGQH